MFSIAFVRDCVVCGLVVWVSRDEFELLRGERARLVGEIARLEDELARVRGQARASVERHRQIAVQAQKQASELAERIVELAKRPPLVVQPPDTAAIVKETVLGMATVLNGWRENASSQVIQHQMLSPDQQGLDDRAGVPQNLDEFVPPWEEWGPTISPSPPVTNGTYAPYIPGSGNAAPSPDSGGHFE